MRIPLPQICFILGEIYQMRIERRPVDFLQVAKSANKKFKRRRPLNGDDTRDVDDNFIKLRSGLHTKPTMERVS